MWSNQGGVDNGGQGRACTKWFLIKQIPAHEKESSKEAQRYIGKKMTLHKCLIQIPLSIY